METSSTCQLFGLPCLSLVNLFLALFATAIAFGYLLKPRLYYCIYTDKNKYKVKVENHNLFFSVKDVQCEVAVASCRSFDKVRQVNLKKVNTLLIRKHWPTKCNYIFTTAESVEVIKSKCNKNPENEGEANNQTCTYLRVRMLAPNFLGVKKHYERIFAIGNIDSESCKTRSYCFHNRNNYS